MGFLGNEIGLFDSFRLVWGLLLTAEGRAALRAGSEVGAMEITRRSIAILNKRGRWQEASQEAELLAVMHRKRGEAELDIQSLKQAIAFFPANWRARQTLALELLKQGETAGALDEVNQVLSGLEEDKIAAGRGETVSLLIDLAKALQQSGYPTDALKCAEKAVDIQSSMTGGVDPLLIDCLESLGATWRTLGFIDQADQTMAKAACLRDQGFTSKAAESERID